MNVREHQEDVSKDVTAPMEVTTQTVGYHCIALGLG